MSSAASRSEFVEHVATAVGMALACSGYAMLGESQRLLSGGWLLGAVLAAGLSCIVLSFSVGELAAMFPSAPGIRTYLRHAFGDTASLALTLLLFSLVGLFASVEVHYFLAAAREVLPELSEFWTGVAVIVMVCAVNLVGLEAPRRMQVAITALLVLSLVGFSWAALAQSDSASLGRNAPPVPPSLATFVIVSGGCVFLFTGFEWVTSMGRSPESYRARIPVAMPVSLCVLLVVIGSLAWASDGLRSEARYALMPHLALGARVGGPLGVQCMVMASLASMITTFNAGLMGASRLLYAVSRERRFFEWGARVSARRGTPYGAVFSLSGLALMAHALTHALHAHGTVELVCAAIYCLVYSAFLVATVRLRQLRPGSPRVFRSPIPAWVQLLVAALFALMSCAVLATDIRLVSASVSVFMAAVVGSALLARYFVQRAPSPRAALRPQSS